VAEPDDLEAAGEALGQPTLDEQWSRAEDDHPKVSPRVRVFVPESLDGLGPGRDLLDLIEDEHRRNRLMADHQCAPDLPLCLEPRPIPESGIVGAHAVDRQIQLADNPSDEDRLADLARARHHVDEPPR
jgi:hypothetical protein